MAKKTGVSMGGRIERTKKVNRIPADCSRCYHWTKKGETTYCRYYDEFSPNRATCARYEPVRPKPKRCK